MTPQSDDAPSSVDRLTQANLSVILERLAATDLVARGCVNLISVEAIRDRAAERWPRRREDVWGYVERRLQERLGQQDLWHRVGETDFLIAQTNEERASAQAVSLRILEEVLLHFLGEVSLPDVKIRAVSGIFGDTLEAANLDPAAIAAASVQTAATSEQRNAIDTRKQRLRNPVVFQSSDGQPLRIDFAVEPVISLRHTVTAALRVESTITQVDGRRVTATTLPQLSDADIFAIDEATMAFAGLYIPNAPFASEPALIVPMSFRTLGGRKGRSLLVRPNDVSAERVKGSVMIEMLGIERGTPASRLVEVSSLVLGVCRGVLARLHHARDMLAPVRGCRFQGLTFDASEANAGSQAKALRDAGAQMHGAAPSLIAQGVRSSQLAAVAKDAGFTHAARRKPEPARTTVIVR